MSATRIQTRAVAQFQCAGDACPDTCCKGWGMQLAAPTVEKYRAAAPELLDAVTSGEAEHIMKRDPITDYCVKFDAGWCGIHRQYGEEFLGDACHFYPRITRAFNDTVTTTLALSCPEAARLMLLEPDAFQPTPREELRVPFSLKNYQQEGLSADDALALHQLLLDSVADPAVTAERHAMRLLMVAQALQPQPASSWLAAGKFYLSMADGRLPAAEPHAADMIYLVQALAGLVAASKATARPALAAVLASMQRGLALEVGAGGQWAATANTPEALNRLQQHALDAQAWLQPLLRRFLQAQLSQASFPFAGLGATPAERMTIMAVRLATTKLALLCEAQGGVLDTARTVAVIYPLARFLDHLADPTLSLAIYQEVGWLRDARLRALLGDA